MEEKGRKTETKYRPKNHIKDYLITDYTRKLHNICLYICIAILMRNCTFSLCLCLCSASQIFVCSTNKKGLDLCSDNFYVQNIMSPKLKHNNNLYKNLCFYEIFSNH